MLIRLLVVVLMLVGPMPFRVCTCAAGSPAQTTFEHGPTIALAPKSCGCEHGSARDAVAPVPDHAGSHSDDSGPPGDAPHPDRHERDCPAANPAPVVRDAVAAAAVDVPTDYVGPAPTVGVHLSKLLSTSLVCRPVPPHASTRPLYITLLSLRN